MVLKIYAGKEALFKGILGATIMCVVGFLLSQFFSHYLVRVFTDNKAFKFSYIWLKKIYTCLTDNRHSNNSIYLIFKLLENLKNEFYL